MSSRKCWNQNFFDVSVRTSFMLILINQYKITKPSWKLKVNILSQQKKLISLISLDAMLLTW